MKALYYLPSPTGSGKSYTFASEANRHVDDGTSVIIVVPTKQLATDTRASINQRFPSMYIYMIHSDTQGESSTATVTQYFIKPYPDAHIIIITWACFVRLKHVNNAHRYVLFIDEIPNVLECFKERLPYSHSIITENLKLTPKGSTYSLIKPADSVMRKIVENKKGDQGYEVIRRLAHLLCHPFYDTYVDAEKFQALMKGSKDEPFLTTYSLLSPSIFYRFKRVVIAGARAEETILFKWWNQIGTDFIVADEMVEQLRYAEHKNGSLIKFYYGSERDRSKTLMTKNDDEQRKNLIGYASRLIGDKDCLWLDNMDMKSAYDFEGRNNIQLLPSHSHGLNTYSHYNNCVVTASYNYDPGTSAFLRNFCRIQPREQKIALCYHQVYQAICRSSIRDPKNANTKTIILPDYECALWHQSVFPGSTVHSLDMPQAQSKKVGRKRVYESSTEQKRASRERLQSEQGKIWDEQLLAHLENRRDEFLRIEECPDITLKTIDSFQTSLQGSIIRHKRDHVTIPLRGDFEHFVQWLRYLSQRTLKDKDDNLLISPGVFDLNKVEGSSRGKDNALFAKNIYLDIEKGHMTHRNLTTIFPRLRLIAYNSFNHTEDHPRYRVIIPTDETMTPGVYTFLYQQIVQKIENSGYLWNNDCAAKPCRRLHGIDSKPNVSDMFYLPSKPSQGKGFFFDYKKDRAPLNVDEWLEHPISTRFDAHDDIIPQQANDITALSDDIEQKRKEAFERYERDISVPGESYKAINKLSKTLIKTGIAGADHEHTLVMAANISRSTRDRMSCVRRLVKSARLYDK